MPLSRPFLRRRAKLDKRQSALGRPHPLADCGDLFVEPPVFAAIAVEDAVDHHRRTFDVGLPARRETVIEDDRLGDILGQIALDRP